MFCKYCGNQVNNNATFCNSCGKKIAKNVNTSNPKSSNQNTTNSGSQTDNPNPNNSVYQNQSSNSSKNQSPTMNQRINNFSDKIDNLTGSLYGKFPGQNSNAQEGTDGKVPYNHATLFTGSNLIDFSGVKKEKTNHPYSALGGFLAFIVYGGFVGLILTCVYMLISIIMLIVSIATISSIGRNLGYGITGGLNTSLGTVIVTILTFIPFIILTFRFLMKIKNKELDFIQYFHKIIVLEAIYIAVIYLVAGIIQYIIYWNMLVSLYGGSYMNAASLSGINSSLWTIFLGPYIGSVVGLLIGIAISTLLMTVYYCNSVRVRIYMGTDAYLRVSPWTRNVMDPISKNHLNSQNNDNNQTQNTSQQQTAQNTSKPQNNNLVDNGPGNNASTNVNTGPANTSNSSKPKFCGNCGHPTSGNSSFCKNCGNRL